MKCEKELALLREAIRNERKDKRITQEELAEMLGSWGKIPVTYAGGVGSFDDLRDLKKLGQNHLDVTIGSALDLFGGQMKFEEVLAYCK